MLTTFSIADLEGAINHCLAREKAEEHSIPVDARRLSDVYGSMIWNSETTRAVSSLTEDELAAFNRWNVI
jgi:hypothetical protein